VSDRGEISRPHVARRPDGCGNLARALHQLDSPRHLAVMACLMVARRGLRAASGIIQLTSLSTFTVFHSGVMAMRKSVLPILVLIVASAGSISSAEEFTLEGAVKAWSFMKGSWTITRPDGVTDEVTVRIASSNNALISESPAALHVFGWDPQTKLLEIQSFMADGTRGKSLFDRKSTKELSGKGGSLIDANGEKRTLDGDAAFTIVDDDTYQFSFNGQTWTAKRKGK
jgi:hypothetical protein